MPAPGWEGFATQLAFFQSSSYGSVHPHLDGNVHASVRDSGIDKARCAPALAPLLPCWSLVVAASGTRVSTKTGIRDGSVRVDQRWLQWANKLLSGLRVWNFRLPCSSKNVQDCNRHFGTQRYDYVPNSPQWSIDPVHSFRTLQEVQRGQWKAFSIVTRNDNSSCLAADHHSLPRLSETCVWSRIGQATRHSASRGAGVQFGHRQRCRRG